LGWASSGAGEGAWRGRKKIKQSDREPSERWAKRDWWEGWGLVVFAVFMFLMVTWVVFTE
ncbi:hypothetical protein CAI21_22635, partial [Alkalilimnicola ehrlichii]|uniref:hypothetical protein n=1 Tax=Alkalilimnicola ehrlichii TaxID=351052 RepID=UPI000E37CC2E